MDLFRCPPEQILEAARRADDNRVWAGLGLLYTGRMREQLDWQVEGAEMLFVELVLKRGVGL